MPKIDKRILQTKSQITKALFTLCNQQVNFSTLSVPKLAKAAGLSRQTFYRYYDSPEQAIITLIDSHLTVFQKNFRFQNLTPHSMTSQLMKTWQERADVFRLVEWSNTRTIFIQRLSKFNQAIAHQNQKNKIDEVPICNVYAAATYMFLRAYILDRQWSEQEATDLFLHLTNQLDQIF